MPALLVAAVFTAGWSQRSVENTNILTIRLPPGITGKDVVRGDSSTREMLRKSIRGTLPSGAKNNFDAIVVFVDDQGKPVLPGPDKQPSKCLMKTTAALAAAENHMSFTFNSPTQPWTSQQVLNLSAQCNTFDSVLTGIMGPPSYTCTVNISKDTTINYAGLYSSNEILLRTYNDPSVICHELVHAFHGAFIIGSQIFEEGMARSIEIEAMDVCPQYNAGYAEKNYSYYFYTCYEFMNTPGMGGAYGAFYNGLNPALMLARYDIAGYAWSKILIENPDFFKNYHRQFYDRMAANGTFGGTCDSLFTLVESSADSVEGKPIRQWIKGQHILDYSITPGDEIVMRTGSWVFNCFSRDVIGGENAVGGIQVDATFADCDGFAVSVFTQTTSATYGCADFNPLFDSYAGRVRASITAHFGSGPLNRTFFRLPRDSWSTGTAGVLGVIKNETSGNIVITRLDTTTGVTASASVANGAFYINAFENVRGCFRADFTRRDGSTVTKYFNKGASAYGVFIDDTRPPDPPTMATAPAANQTGAGCGLISGQGSMPAVRMDRPGIYRLLLVNTRGQVIAAFNSRGMETISLPVRSGTGIYFVKVHGSEDRLLRIPVTR